MPSIPFTVSARTAKLIGQENFANAQGAIIELVKNSYDADATFCLIIFEKSTLYIIDNGVGMTKEVIQNEWMTIGTNNKQKQHTSTNERIKTGAKGIGRFALDRLCIRTTVYTYSGKTKKPLLWKVKWNNFNKEGIAIHDVKAIIREIDSINTLKQILLKKFNKNTTILNIINSVDDKLLETGTILKLENIKDNWYYDELAYLNKSLEVLMPPKELSSDFEIFLVSKDYPSDFGKIDCPELSDYDYKVEAEYFPENNHTLEVRIIRNELDKDRILKDYNEIFDYKHMQTNDYSQEVFRKDNFLLKKNFKQLKTFNNVDEKEIEKIGKFNFTFYFLKLSKSDDNESALVKYPIKDFIAIERKEFLRRFGGIKIFRDNFRVRPYGENGEDWLNLGHRQASNTWGVGQSLGGYKVKPTQVLGQINISRLTNTRFEDKSGREGIQENQTFDLFKNVIIEIISFFETDRNAIMHSLYKLSKKRNADVDAMASASKAANRVLNKKSSSNESMSTNKNQKDTNNDKDNETLAKAALAYEAKVKEQDEEIRLLRNLASVGLIISSFSHEVHNLRTRLVPRNIHLKECLQSLISEEDIKHLNKYDNPFYMLEMNHAEDIKLKHWLDYSLNSLKKDKRKRKTINLVDYFNQFMENWSRVLKQRKIYIFLEKEKNVNFEMKSFEVDLDVIFNNLLSNAMNALRQVNSKEKFIKIEMKCEKDSVIILFNDNGIGLSKEYIHNPEKIFEALESSKVDKHGNQIGTGLGLYLVKTTVDEYSESDLTIVEPKYKGFSIKLKFKLFK